MTCVCSVSETATDVDQVPVDGGQGPGQVPGQRVGHCQDLLQHRPGQPAGHRPRQKGQGHSHHLIMSQCL